MEEKKESIIPFVIETSYPTFHEFYEKEKHLIYQKIVEAYEEMVSANDGDKILLIVAKAKGTTFDTKFQISKDNVQTLLTVISPYFEELEEYEYCARIVRLHSKLISQQILV